LKYKKVYRLPGPEIAMKKNRFRWPSLLVSSQNCLERDPNLPRPLRRCERFAHETYSSVICFIVMLGLLGRPGAIALSVIVPWVESLNGQSLFPRSKHIVEEGFDGRSPWLLHSNSARAVEFKMIRFWRKASSIHVAPRAIGRMVTDAFVRGKIVLMPYFAYSHIANSFFVVWLGSGEGVNQLSTRSL
jgi:hypothetical protein